MPTLMNVRRTGDGESLTQWKERLAGRAGRGDTQDIAAAWCTTERQHADSTNLPISPIASQMSVRYGPRNVDGAITVASARTDRTRSHDACS